MLDHAGEAPWGGGIDTTVELAGLSRELAANDWQWRRFEQHPRFGRAHERNACSPCPTPTPEPALRQHQASVEVS